MGRAVREPGEKTFYKGRLMEGNLPASTYRLQLNKSFTFENAAGITGYLSRLGITHLYLSPILKARPGSSHGYDVTDPTRLNPELGGMKGFKKLVEAARGHKMGIVVDIVPNHMAASPGNKWWSDVLANGIDSPFAKFFDIRWEMLSGKILLPVLNEPLDETICKKLIKIVSTGKALFLSYRGYKAPLNIKSCLELLEHAMPAFEATSLYKTLRFENQPEADCRKGRYRQAKELKKSLKHTLEEPRVRQALAKYLEKVNDRPEDIKLIVDQQYYVLDYWKDPSAKLNYRRFFDIDDMIGVRVEDPVVFEKTHSMILKLVCGDFCSGLRVDHIDGLKLPEQYLKRLSRKAPGVYVVVEKILSDQERIKRSWPVCGTTGYDFIKIANELFVNRQGTGRLDGIYRNYTGFQGRFKDIARADKKKAILQMFAPDSGMLACMAARQASLPEAISYAKIRSTLENVTACLPVYRTYIKGRYSDQTDCRHIACAASLARNMDGTDPGTLDYIQKILKLAPGYYTNDGREFTLEWQQWTGAVMAKGYEDTALYNFSRLISLNEVGGDPSSNGINANQFHARIIERNKSQPAGLNASSTHDTKRSEDVRARINVLSEMPGKWACHLAKWTSWNAGKKKILRGSFVPGPDAELFIYQTLLGAWPLESGDIDSFIRRMKSYLVKASREAKIYTNWIQPDSAYEKAVEDFLVSITTQKTANRFLPDFLSFLSGIAFYGAINSLSQVLLKISCPGVPDFYQGSEMWDFSLVDPDNRRPVDYEQKARALDSMLKATHRKTFIADVLDNWQNGRVKLYVINKALEARNRSDQLFQSGEYVPLRVSGSHSHNCLAFARVYGNKRCITLVPRFASRLVAAGTMPVGEVWGKTALLAGEKLAGRYENVFTRKVVEIQEHSPIGSLLYEFPLAMLASCD